MRQVSALHHTERSVRVDMVTARVNYRFGPGRRAALGFRVVPSEARRLVQGRDTRLIRSDGLDGVEWPCRPSVGARETGYRWAQPK